MVGFLKAREIRDFPLVPTSTVFCNWSDCCFFFFETHQVVHRPIKFPLLTLTTQIRLGTFWKGRGGRNQVKKTRQMEEMSVILKSMLVVFTNYPAFVKR